MSCVAFPYMQFWWIHIFDVHHYRHKLCCINLCLLMVVPLICLHLSEVAIWSPGVWDLQRTVGTADVLIGHWYFADCLTHCSWNKMATFNQTTFLNAFSWMKMYKFWLRLHSSLYLSVQLIIFQQMFRWWLDTMWATSHYLNQWWSVYRCIRNRYVSFDLLMVVQSTGLILGLRSASERCCYTVTPCLIGWAPT